MISKSRAPAVPVCFPNFHTFGTLADLPILEKFRECSEARRAFSAQAAQLKVVIEILTKAQNADSPAEDTAQLKVAEAAYATSQSLIQAFDDFSKLMIVVPEGKSYSPLARVAMRAYLKGGANGSRTYLLYLNVVSSGGEVSIRKFLWYTHGIVFLGGCVVTYVLADLAGKTLASGTLGKLSQTKYGRGQKTPVQFEDLTKRPTAADAPGIRARRGFSGSHDRPLNRPTARTAVHTEASMKTALPLCIEMEPAPDLRDSAVRLAVMVNPLNAASSQGEYTRYWQPGTRLRVCFTDGDPTLQRRVASVATEWSEYANIEFWFGETIDAEIRITFVTSALWSYVGTDALLVPKDQPTMCLGALAPKTGDQRLREVVLHEFGHALGLIHEHPTRHRYSLGQAKGLRIFERPALLLVERTGETYISPGSGGPDITQFLMFDPQSIMRAPVPKAFTIGGFEIAWNEALSATDKEFAASVYPHFSAASREAATAPAEKGLEEEHIRLDALYPAQARVEEAFEIAVAIRQPDAPVLTIEDLPKVTSEEGIVYRPAGEDVIKYRIEAVGTDCTISPPGYEILLHRGENARPRYFEVTAHKPGWRTVFINAYQEDGVNAAQTRVRIEVQLAVQEPGPTNSIAITDRGESFHGHRVDTRRSQAVQGRAEERIQPQRAGAGRVLRPGCTLRRDRRE